MSATPVLPVCCVLRNRATGSSPPPPSPLPIAQKDSRCKHKVTPEGGWQQTGAVYTGTWTVSDNMPTATYFVRALVKQGGTYVATGVSTGFFQIDSINSRPTSLKIAAGVLMPVGPLLLASYFIWERLKKKAV